jgi:DNA polymerase-3 subunit alpha
VKRVKELGQTSVGLMDYGNVFNAIPFYKAARAEGIKPILGVEVFLTLDNEQAKLNKDRKVWHLALIAENNTGWKNIARILSLSNNEDGFYFRARVDFKMLEAHSEGIIVLGGSSFDGVIPFHLYDKMDEEGQVREAKAVFKANGLVRRLVEIFGTDHVFLEVQDHGYDMQKEVNERLRNLAAKNGIRCVGTNNVHYVKQSNAEAHNTLRSMGYNPHNPMTLTDFAREEFYLKSRDEMNKTSLLHEELELASEIADRCNVEIDLKRRRLPSYRFLPDGASGKNHLRKLASRGLADRGLTQNID